MSFLRSSIPTWLTLASALGVAALVTAGCGSESSDLKASPDGGAGSGGSSAGRPCVSDKQCKADHLLCDTTRGQCVECRVATDCPAHHDCTSGACVPYEACENSLDCPSGKVCDAAESRCYECVTSADCETGALCAQHECRVTCKSDKDCTPLGLLCDKLTSQCVACRDSGDCTDGEICASGKCEAGARDGGSGGSSGRDGSAPGDGGGPAPGCIDADAYDFPGNHLDEDCSGVADDAPASCVAPTVDIAYNDPKTAAKAIELCAESDGASPGVVSARYVKADGSSGMAAIGHGLLDHFGDVIVPRRGPRLLALSSGTARSPGDPGYQATGSAEHNTRSAPPPLGVSRPFCGDSTTAPSAVYDSVGLEIVLRVPSNAHGFSFDFDFFSFEFPSFVCSTFNDRFVALVSPEATGATEANVVFDSRNNQLSVNNDLIETCTPQTIEGRAFACARGPSELAGTGFDGVGVEATEAVPHASSGWLTTSVPATPGELVTLRFALWDEGDANFDSTVLLDNFTWLAKAPPAASTVRAK
ncbi:MAG: choice-of-anchor L domain-containing protein [Sorangiineae bacterium]|nr:choice-of-anchor L domain-containing protein [Sorangiineae bacterium]